MGDDTKMAVRAVETGERKDRILIVEDEDNARKGYEQLLQKWGYDVLGVASAEDVLAKFASYQPDTLIADVELPGMNGLDLLKQLGADLHGPEHGRVKASAVAQGLRGQRDGQPGRRERPGHQVGTGRASKPHHRHDGANCCQQRAAQRRQEGNRHYRLWCLTRAQDATRWMTCRPLPPRSLN